MALLRGAGHGADQHRRDGHGLPTSRPHLDQRLPRLHYWRGRPHGDVCAAPRHRRQPNPRRLRRRLDHCRVPCEQRRTHLPLRARLSAGRGLQGHQPRRRRGDHAGTPHTSTPHPAPAPPTTRSSLPTMQVPSTHASIFTHPTSTPHLHAPPPHPTSAPHLHTPPPHPSSATHSVPLPTHSPQTWADAPYWIRPGFRALTAAKWDVIILMLGTNDAKQHGQECPLGCDPARLLHLLGTRLAALGSSALPGRGRLTGRPATASGARASRLQDRRSHRL